MHILTLLVLLIIGLTSEFKNDEDLEKIETKWAV